MSIEVRPATPADAQSVAELLHAHMSSKISMEGWRRLLEYPWRPADADCGQIALDGGRAVGFLGLVYADRVLRGRPARFCNICAWYLQKDYRGRGIGQRMQRDAVADPRLTYTLVTATQATERAFRRDGLTTLDDERWLFRPGPGGTSHLTVVEGDLSGQLDLIEQAILHDHRGFRLRHILASADGCSCYLVVQVSKQGDDISYHQVMHASDLPFLREHAQALADRLVAGGRAVFAIDRRFMADEPAGAELERLRQVRLFRSPGIDPALVDHLYNEIVLLDLKLP